MKQFKKKFIIKYYLFLKSVVSGTTEPDTIVLQRDFNNNKLHIHSEVIGSKKVKIIMKSDSGIESEEVNEKEGNVLCLTHKQIFQLGSVAWIIEKSFGYPLDIEWAFEKVYENNFFF